jgi:hypothetical protein
MSLCTALALLALCSLPAGAPALAAAATAARSLSAPAQPA